MAAQSAEMGRLYRLRSKRPRWLLPTTVFLAVFGATTYALAPDATGKAHLAAEWDKRTTDQHYSDCDEARANGHESIQSYEPSYRTRMDRDGDGVACEPYRGR